ncbi:MAG: DUF2142 domain-containing protein [Anaerolineae bacterium]
MIDRLRSGNLLLALVLFALLRGVVYASVIPPWQAPDEFRHFEYARLIAEYRRPVTYADLSPQLEEEIIASLSEFDYWKFGYSTFPFDESNPPRRFVDFVAPVIAHSLYQPPLYYLLGASVILPLLREDVVLQMYAVRLASLFLGALTVIIAFLVAGEIFPDDLFLKIGAPAFVALLPMHAFIAASVNNEVLAEFVTSLLFLLLVRGLIKGWSWPEITLVPVLVILAWYTKRTALVTFPLVLATLPLWWASRRQKVERRWLLGIPGGLAAAITVLIIAAASLHPFLTQLSPKAIGYLVWPEDIFAFILDRERLSPEALRLYGEFLRTLLESFWARFGWMNVPLGEGWYLSIAIVCLLSLAGLVLFGIRVIQGRNRLSPSQVAALLLFLLGVVLQLGIVVVGQLRVREAIVPGSLPQGRYLFPVIVPLATLFMLGLRELVSPRHRQGLLTASLAGFLLLLDVASLLFYILPFYYL